MEGVVHNRRNPINRIRVFISSKCGDGAEFDTMRAELADLLEETSIFMAYLWEREGASSIPAVDNYSLDLKDSDVCVFVVDNASEIPVGVQKEVKLALKLNKPSFFYFCNHKNEDEPELQKYIRDTGIASYQTVTSLVDVPDLVLIDLQSEIFKLYRAWCNHALTAKTDENESFAIVEAAQLTKEVISKFPGTLDVFRQFIFNEQSGDVPLAGLDTEASKLARALYIDTNIDTFNPAGLIRVACALLPKEYASVIEKRWKGDQQYFKGNTAEALNLLDTALKEAK